MIFSNNFVLIFVLFCLTQLSNVLFVKSYTAADECQDWFQVTGNGTLMHNSSFPTWANKTQCLVIKLAFKNISYVNPGVFDGLVNLEHLHLHDNFIKTIDRGVLKDSYNSIKGFFVHNNKLTAVPEDIVNFTAPTYLWLQNNEIAHVTQPFYLFLKEKLLQSDHSEELPEFLNWFDMMNNPLKCCTSDEDNVNFRNLVTTINSKAMQISCLEPDGDKYVYGYTADLEVCVNDNDVDSGEGHEKNETVVIAVISSVVGVVVIFIACVVGYYFCYYKRKKNKDLLNGLSPDEFVNGGATIELKTDEEYNIMRGSAGTAVKHVNSNASSDTTHSQYCNVEGYDSINRFPESGYDVIAYNNNNNNNGSSGNYYNESNNNGNNLHYYNDDSVEKTVENSIHEHAVHIHYDVMGIHSDSKMVQEEGRVEGIDNEIETDDLNRQNDSMGMKSNSEIEDMTNHYDSLNIKSDSKINEADNEIGPNTENNENEYL